MRISTRWTALCFVLAACSDSSTSPTDSDAGHTDHAAANTTDAGSSDATVGGGDAGSDAAPDAGLTDASSDATAPQALVSHSGRWIIDAQGRVLIVHGVNVVNKLTPYTAQGWGFGDDDAAFLVDHGFNAVRLGVLWEAVEPQPGVYDDNYIAQIRQTQLMLASHGIYTLLDWHQDEYNEMFGGEGLPAWAVNTGGLLPASPHDKFPDEYNNDPAQKAAWDNLYLDKSATDTVGPQERLAAAEAYVAETFAGEPWVLGYDVINEPSAGSASEPTADMSDLGPFEKKLMQSIRTVDTRHLVFYEPTSTFGLNGISLPAFGDSNAGISFHDYCFEPGTTPQSVYTLLCGGVLDSSQTSALNHASAGASAGGDAVLMTEFGSATAFAVQMVADDADKNMVPWLSWAYCGCGDPTTALDPTQEGIVIDPKQLLSASNLDNPLLAVLVRPYPQAIAGTPTSWSYDATTGAFSLIYNAASPPGATLAAGANTVVYLPSADYPNGYTATVAHGSVVSGNGTPRIVIATDPGATNVSVSVVKK